jgi:mRNA-degrading endonuclease RelE of RelBE toxin-antitoxin system
VSTDEGRYQLVLARSAVVTLAEKLPEKVALAVFGFIKGPLLDNPQHVGRRLREPLAPAYAARRGFYRVLYFIDDTTKTVKVTAIAHRSDAYRT